MILANQMQHSFSRSVTSYFMYCALAMPLLFVGCFGSTAEKPGATTTLHWVYNGDKGEEYKILRDTIHGEVFLNDLTRRTAILFPNDNSSGITSKLKSALTLKQVDAAEGIYRINCQLDSPYVSAAVLQYVKTSIDGFQESELAKQPAKDAVFEFQFLEEVKVIGGTQEQLDAYNEFRKVDSELPEYDLSK